MPRAILALDQGTTSSRAILFDRDGGIVAVAQQEFPQLLPQPGHVEHDPEAIWESQLAVAREALQQASLTAADVAAIGVTNQRETTIVWDRESGRAVANAIVWQSRASAEICERLKAAGCEETIRRKTGLRLDPYFSASKIRYLFERDPALRPRAERGELLFGTVDSWLLWRLSGGRCHVTDVSNASRTLLLDIDTCRWDDELLEIFDVPRAMLPEVRASSEVYGEADAEWLGGPIPLAGDAGDQQAATFGQGCLTPGSVKNTYGTGCFMLLNTGSRPVHSQHNLLTTVGWQVGGRTTYCLEGSVFIAGAVVQWLRDGLRLIENSSDVQALAASVPDTGGVFFVPAFVGLGAPYWDPYARGTIVGLTRGTTDGHLARAAVESMAYQSRDLLDAMRLEAAAAAENAPRLEALKVDGGASRNDDLMQFQADLLDLPVRRPVVAETTALGAARLAGLAVGFWKEEDEIAWQLDREFVPRRPRAEMDALYARWQEAVARSRGWEQPAGGA